MEKYRRHLNNRPRRRTLLGHTYRSGCAAKREVASQSMLRRQSEIEHDLQLARDIQQGLLLEAVPQLPGWEISAISLPARELGGDLYDFLPLGNGRQGIMIGDVSGKGLPAALRMAVARTVFRHAARSNRVPGRTLAETNCGVLSEIPQGMVTMLYAVLDTRNGTLTFANAGHNYPVLIDSFAAELELSGMPLGIDEESEYPEMTVSIPPGATVVLYTDGVVEASTRHGAIYGYERLAGLLSARAGVKPRTLVAELLHTLRHWNGSEQTDDITIVVMRRRLAHLSQELRSIAVDVLGAGQADETWAAIPLPGGDEPAVAWVEAIPALVNVVRERFGRGLARELYAQLRLVIEEYR